MCLIAIAHRVSATFPLVLAANRDEDHDRPTTPARYWEDDPRILGGRDTLHGGTWLAISRSGRFAAVTNLRGSETKSRSRGFLVRDFVRGDAAPLDFAEGVARDADSYSGFHLILGQVGADVIHYTNGGGAAPRVLPRGIHAISNGPIDARWPKVVAAEQRISDILAWPGSAEEIAREALRFLGTPGAAAAARGTTEMDEAPSDVFILGPQYGTRSSTAIVVSATGEVLFVERGFERAGLPMAAGAVGFRFTAELPKPVVLIVDDEPDIRDLVARALRADGFDVVEAGGGREAIEHLRKRPVALIVLDLIMQEGSGSDVLSHVESMKEAPRVIILSALGDTWAKRRDTTAQMVLTKPVDLGLLRAAVKRAVTGALV